MEASCYPLFNAADVTSQVSPLPAAVPPGSGPAPLPCVPRVVAVSVSLIPPPLPRSWPPPLLLNPPSPHHPTWHFCMRSSTGLYHPCGSSPLLRCCIVLHAVPPLIFFSRSTVPTSLLSLPSSSSPPPPTPWLPPSGIFHQPGGLAFPIPVPHT